MYNERKSATSNVLPEQERERIIASLRAENNIPICFHLMDSGVSPQSATDISYDAWEALRDPTFDPRLRWSALVHVSRVATMIAACEPQD